MKQLVPHLSIRNFRIFSACLLSLLLLMAPMAPLAASVNRIAAAHAEQNAERKLAHKLAHNAKKQMTPREALENALFANSLAQKPSINVGPNISATLQDSFVDTNATNRADPGSTVTYTAVVSNTGSDASGVSFTDTPDPNTTLVGGSVKVSPLAFADTYGATINTPLSVVAPGVLTNDTGTPAPTAVPIAAGPTTAGGTVTLNANGSFTYNPPSAVFTGADTFTYSATNGQAPNDSATVTINVGPANANPVANDDTASATEAGGAANGTAGTNPSGNLVTGTGSAGAVADTDAEDPTTSLVVVAVKTGPEGTPVTTGTVGSPLAGTYGSLTLNSNGSYTYTVDNNNSSVQALRLSSDTLPDVFNYTIQDTGAAQDTATFTVTIHGANDAPTDIALTANTVAENQPINTVVGTLSTTDVDTGDTFTYTLVGGTGSTDNGSFNINGNQLRTSASFDFETKSSYAIRIRATDAGGLFFEKQFTITVTNVNETPTDIALSSNTIGENMPINTVIGNFSTTDPDAGDTFTYTLVVGAGSTDNGSFNINGNQLRSSAIFDFETKSSYSIRVRSTDAGSLFFEKVFTITIVNNNDAPTDIALSNSSVAENSAINTVVGNFSTTDQDVGNTFTYTLVVGVGDTDNASFNINGAQLRTSASFDFETKSSYTIRVRSTDNAAAFFEKQFTITVTDVPEAPVLVTSVGSASFTEDGPAVAVDTGITVADQDSPTLASATIQITGNLQPAEDVLAFTNDGSTMGNIAVSVAYNSATGLLTLGSAGNTATLTQWQSALRAVTYNNTSQNPTVTARTVSFRVNDGALNSNIATKGVTVTAVNDAPVLGGVSGGFTYTENDAATAIAPAITVSDVDNATLTTGTVTISANYQSAQDVLSFTNNPGTMGNILATGNTGGVLTLTSAGGTATLAQWQAAFAAVKYNNSSDDPSTLTRTVTFQVDDGQSVNHASNTPTRTITITAVNDPPTANAFASLPAQAGIPISYPIGKLGGTDVEAGTTVTIDTVAINQTNGTASLNADGSFVFTPLPNATTGSFQYRVYDNGNPNGGPSPTGGVFSSYVTVSFTVAGPAIYFVRQSAVGLGNCTLGNECTLATAQANIGAATNTRIFVEDNGSGPYTTSVTLNSNGWLIGQGVTGTTFDALFGIVAPVGGGTLAARPLLAQASPTITVSSAGVNVVNLCSASCGASTNAVRGLVLTTGTNTTKAISGTSFGTLTTSDLIITGSGPALDLTTGSLAGSFTSISSSGGANGIKLSAIGGSSTLGSGALSGATAEEFFVTGTNSTVTLTYSGTISTTVVGSRPVSISGKTSSGPVTFTGAVSSTALGVNLDNNDGALITFRGGLSLTTTTTTAFNAINGGTIEVCDESPCNPAATGGLVNTLTTTTGTALNVNATTISSNNLEFRSINSPTASANPGIVLNNTGATGGLTVTGTSTTAGTGGTISNKTGNGVDLRTTNNITLKNMNLTNNASSQSTTNTACGNGFPAGNNLGCVANLYLQTTTGVTLTNLSVSGSTQEGINGNAVNTLTMSNMDIHNNGNEDYENGLLFQNLFGTVTFTNVNDHDNFSRQAYIDNGSGGTTTGTLTLNVTGSTFGRTIAPLTSSQQGLLIVTRNSTAANVDVGTTTIVKNGNGNGLQINVVDTATLGSSGTHSSLHNSTNLSENAAHIFVNTTGGAVAYFDTMNNTTITKAGLQSFDYFVNPASTAGGSLTGIIQGNTIGTSGSLGSACNRAVTLGGCDGMTIDKDGAGAMSLRIQSNIIQQVETNGIALGSNNSGSVNALITSNTLRQPGYSGGGANAQGNALLFNVGATGGSTIQPCLNPTGNTISDTSAAQSWDPNGSAATIYFNTNTTTITHVPGYAGANNSDAQFQAYVASLNTITFSAGQAVLATRFNGSLYGGGAACTTPLLLAEGGVESAWNSSSQWLSVAHSQRNEFATLVSPSRCGASAEKASTVTAPSLITASLDQPRLDSIVATAIERWTATGLSQEQIRTLRSLRFDVANLDGIYLGEASGGHVQIDRNAGGKGWFTGADSSSDSLFSRAVSTTRRYTDPLSAPAGHLDLLTAIEHEMGHKLGLNDTYAERDRDNLMYGYLTVGERRLPAPGQARNAKPGNQATQHLKLRSASRRAGTVSRRSDKPITPLVGGNVNAIIGTLPGGKSVTITFQVTLNVAMPAGTTQVSTDGTVSGSNFTSVYTNDPDTPGNPTFPGTHDPTITPIDAPTASTSTVSGRILDDNGNPVEGAVIRLSGPQNRKTITDANGNYNFTEVDTNGFYTVTPSRVNYNFAPATRAFSALGAHTEASFAGTFNGSHQNPLDTTEYFVRQQYVDFLGREPEEKGFNDWTDTINNCESGDASCDRIHVSEDFFRSEEFQQRGYFVYRFYSTALGRKPDFAEFTPDMARVSGFLTNDQLEAAKTAFANDFVTRPAFAQFATMTNAQYVDALAQTAGVTLGNRQALVNSLEAGTLTRAQALRQIAESGEVYQRYYNQAFVVMEYFGYLRRDPDALYLNWISVLDANPADSRHMVEGFVDATEYRNRFKQ